MTDVLLIYRPYRSQIVAAYAGIIFEIFWLVLLGGLLFTLHSGIAAYVFISIAAILTAYLIKFGFDSRRIVVCFTKDGLHLINDGKTPWRFIPWENFAYAYYQIGSKCTYLVLSSQELDDKQVKSVTRRASWKACITVNHTVVFPINLIQNKDTAKIREIIKEKVS